MQKHWSADHSLLMSLFVMVAAGLFFLPKIAFALSGPASVFAWFIAGLLGVNATLMLQHVLKWSPRGLFLFLLDHMGRMQAFLVGWLLWWTFTIGTVMTITGSVEHLVSSHFLRLVLALLFTVVLVYFWASYESSMRMIWNTAAIALLIGVAFVLFAGIPVNSELLVTPLITESIVISIVFCFVAFLSSILVLTWDRASYQDCLPRAVLIGGVCSFVILFFVSLLVVPVFGDVSILILRLGSNWQALFSLIELFVLMVLGALWYHASCRIIADMAGESVFVRRLALKSPDFGRRERVFWFQSVICALLILFGFRFYETAIELLAVLLLVVFACILICALWHTKKVRGNWRKVRSELSVMLLFDVVLLIFFVTNFAPEAGKLVVGLLITAIPLYLLLETYYNNRLVRKTNQALVYCTVFSESLFYPSWFRALVLNRLQLNKDMHVLELGCSVGTFTRDLVRIVPEGRVFAVDISPMDVKFAIQRLLRRGDRNIRAGPDPRLFERVTPKITKVHAVLGHDILNHAKSIPIILRDLNHKIPVKSIACFVESRRLIDLTPNEDLLLNESKLRKIFKTAGFRIRIELVKTVFSDYVLISATKVHSA